MPFAFKPHFDRALPYAPFLKRYAAPENAQRWQNQYDRITLTPAQLAELAAFKRKMPILCMSGPWCGDCVEQCPITQKIAEARPDLIDLRFINREAKFNTAPAAHTPEPPAIDEDDIRNRPIGKILVKWGILTPERVQKAVLVQEEQRSRGLNVKIGDVMTDLGMITTIDRDRALAQQSGFVTLEDADRELANEISIMGAPRVPMYVFLTEEFFEAQRFGERPLATYRAKVAKMGGPMCSTGIFAPPPDLLAANIAEWLAVFERVQLMLATSPRLMKLHGEV